MSKSLTENRKRRTSDAKFTQHHQAHPNAGKTFHPRSLFRGMSVPYSNKPGQKYLHPERHRTIREVST